jgi:hypothetical protein
MAKARAPKADFVTAEDLRRMLRVRCAAPEWAMFEEVRNGVGSAHQRSADAVAMNLWPSRGLEVHGFEIKVSRRDRQRERDRPQKADGVGRYCDRWWLVVPCEILRAEELPPAWGLLVARGGRLVAARDASLLTPEPLDRSFVAAMLRRAHEQLADMVPKADIQPQINAAVESGRQWGIAHVTGDGFARLQKSVQGFEEKSGIKIDDYNGARIGEDLAKFQRLEGALEEARWRLTGIAKSTAAIIKAANEAIAAAADPKDNP